MLNANLANSSILIVASMHRSGSSLTAALLQSAGLDIGERLMPPMEENAKGYFENLDFLEFHETVLRSQGIDRFGWTLQEKIDVEDRFIQLAQEIVAQNSISALWGWKEPRTTLFLDFWAELLPTANFLFVYRSPWEVVDSLYRRQRYGRQSDEIFKEKPELAVKFWIHYNRKILDLVNRFPDRCFLININTLISSQNLWIEALNQKFQINLQSPDDQIYDPSLLHTQVVSSYAIAHYFPEAIDLLRELETRAWQGDKKSDLPWQDLLKPDLYRIWAFQNWVDLRRLEGQDKMLQTELEQVKSQLHQTEEVLEQSQSQLHQAQTELEQSQSQLHQTEEILEQSQSQLHQAQTELEQSQSQLNQTQHLLGQSQSQLHQTEEVLEQFQSQLHQTEEVLEQFQSQLHQTKEALEQSQSQLHQAQTELEQSQSQLSQTEKVLEQSQSQLHQTEEVLEQSQSQLHQAQAELEQAKSQMQMQISQGQAELAEVKSQLHQAELKLAQTTAQLRQHKQKELERSQLQDQLIRSHIEQKQIHYQLFVWEAWYAYHYGDSLAMQIHLQHSLKHTPFSRTQTILNWLESFRNYSSEKGCLFDSLSLTNSYEWQQLVKPIAIRK